MDYDVEEVLGIDGSTCVSLVVRFTLPEDVTSPSLLELLFEPDGFEDGGNGCALVMKLVDEYGTPTCFTSGHFIMLRALVL